MRLLAWLAVGSVLVYGFSCGGGSGGSDAGRPSGAGGGPTGGAGGGTIDTHPQTPTAFCLAYNREYCALAFQCVPAAQRDATFTEVFGASLSDCQNTVVPGLCTTATTDCPGFDAGLAGTCMTSLASYTCTDLANSGDPGTCLDACSTFSGTGGTTGAGGMVGAGGAIGTGGWTGSGGTSGVGGRTGAGGASGTGGISGQLPLCPADYETADCTVANQSCRIDCASGLCGCTCMSLGSSLRWSCVIF